MSTRIPRDYVKCQPSSSACFKQNELAACCRRLLSKTISKEENIKLSLYLYMKWASSNDLLDIWRSLIYLKLWPNIEVPNTSVFFFSSCCIFNEHNSLEKSKIRQHSFSCHPLWYNHMVILIVFPSNQKKNACSWSCLPIKSYAAFPKVFHITKTDISLTLRIKF